MCGKGDCNALNSTKVLKSSGCVSDDLDMHVCIPMIPLTFLNCSELRGSYTLEYMLQALSVRIERPFQRLTYSDAMEQYGCDKPDTRYALKLCTVTDAVRGSSFR